MNFVKSISQQLSSVWTQSSRLGRVAFAGTALICVAIVVGVGIWSSRPDYVPLATNLAPAEAAEIISKLDAAGIPNSMNFSGSTVLVAKSQWNQARVLMGDTASGSSSSAPDSLSDSLLSDPTMNRYRILKNREETLARTIMRLDSVVKATVHIAQSEASPFLREQEPTTASVVLELKPGASFTREQAAAVVAMVANSVEGMHPAGVSVMDTKGRMLSSNSSSATGDIANQFEYRGQLEADLASKAELMLAEMLGQGHAIVRVTAAVDFTQSERVETVYDPTIKVKKSERIKSTSRSNATSSAGGAVGTASNMRSGGGGSSGSSPVHETEEENETEFETGKNVYTYRDPSGTLKRLTIAAVVDLQAANRDKQADPQAAAGGTPAAATTITKDKVEALIKQAVGFDLAARGDQIEVLDSELAGATFAIADNSAAKDKMEFYSDLARNSSLGLAALAAVTLGMLIMRKMKPITLPAKAESELPLDRARSLAELAMQARHDPAAVATLLSDWLEERSGAANNETLRRAA